jgi:hypothetical protein
MINVKMLTKIVITVFTVGLLITGCGEKQSEYGNDADGTSATMTDTEIIENDTELQSVQEDSNHKKFECLQEIKDASIDSGKVQIDDMVFTICGSMDNVFDALDKSECTYEYDYLPESIVAQNDSIQLILKKNSVEYCIINAHNYNDTTCKLSECTVVCIQPRKASYENAYFSGGFSSGDTYDDIIKQFEKFELVKEDNNPIDNEYEAIYRLNFSKDHRSSKDKGSYIYMFFNNGTMELKYWIIMDGYGLLF